MNRPSIIARVVRAMLRRLRSIREDIAMGSPAPTQAVGKKRKAAEITINRLLMAEVFAATGKTFPAAERGYQP